MQCNEWCSIREKREKIFIPVIIRNVNQHENSWDQLRKPVAQETHREHSGKLYTRINFKKNRECQNHSRNLLWNAIDLLLKFRDSKWKGVDFHNFVSKEIKIASKIANGKKNEKPIRIEDVTTRVAKGGNRRKGTQRKCICQRRKPVRYGSSTWIEQKIPGIFQF